MGSPHVSNIHITFHVSAIVILGMYSYTPGYSKLPVHFFNAGQKLEENRCLFLEGKFGYYASFRSNRLDVPTEKKK